MTGHGISGLTAGQIATLACQLEVTAPKPGNVHRAADFEDVTLIDFLSSGVAIGSAIDAHPVDAGTGDLILDAVKKTRLMTQSNTNLGMILLICPVAKLVQRNIPICVDALKKCVAEIRGADCQQVYKAFALSNAGGMGRQANYDVNDASSAPHALLSAMQVAASFDTIARQYCSGFQDVFEFVLPAIEAGQRRFGHLTSAIVYAHIKTMAEFPDSLIARKLGDEVAAKSAVIARQALEQLTDNDDEDFWRAVGDLDFWLRSDGHRRNPGTTADLIATAVYVGVLSNQIKPPF